MSKQPAKKLFQMGKRFTSTSSKRPEIKIGKYLWIVHTVDIVNDKILKDKHNRTGMDLQKKIGRHDGLHL